MQKEIKKMETKIEIENTKLQAFLMHTRYHYVSVWGILTSQ
jgi:hypothetical protein